MEYTFNFPKLATKPGEFSPLKVFFILGKYYQNNTKAHIFGNFLTEKVTHVIKFDKIWFEIYFGRFFH
jgi:hypothetical protein